MLPLRFHCCRTQHVHIYVWRSDTGKCGFEWNFVCSRENFMEWLACCGKWNLRSFSWLFWARDGFVLDLNEAVGYFKFNLWRWLKKSIYNPLKGNLLQLLRFELMIATFKTLQKSQSSRFALQAKLVSYSMKADSLSAYVDRPESAACKFFNVNKVN